MRDIIWYCFEVFVLLLILSALTFVGVKVWERHERERGSEPLLPRSVEVTPSQVRERLMPDMEKAVRENEVKGKGGLTGRNFDVAVVTCTLWREARGEGRKGIEAVASVIANRMRERNLSAMEVCLEKGQFSCWRSDEVVTPTSGFFRKDKSNLSAEESKVWDFCLRIAVALVNGRFTPRISANHYYNPSKCRPSWGRKMKSVTVIGRHRFGRV